MSVVLYSTHCPKCQVLEKKMEQKNIEFELVTDQDIMIEKGFLSAPVLDVDGEILDFNKAVKFVNNWRN